MNTGDAETAKQASTNKKSTTWKSVLFFVAMVFAAGLALYFDYATEPNRLDIRNIECGSRLPVQQLKRLIEDHGKNKLLDYSNIQEVNYDPVEPSRGCIADVLTKNGGSTVFYKFFPAASKPGQVLISFSELSTGEALELRGVAERLKKQREASAPIN